MKNAETLFAEIVNQFKADAEVALKEAIDSIHSEMLPYINEDTDANATYRAADIVNKIIAGDFKMINDKMYCDGWMLRLTTFEHDKLTRAIASVKGDEAKDKRIEMLESKVAELIEEIYK